MTTSGREESVRLKDKVAVITGGASGMGKSTVLRFLAEGADVVVADFNAETGAGVVAEAQNLGFGDHIQFIKTDVADEQDVEAMLAHAVESFGRLDVLFNNAGVGGAIGPLTETTVQAWDYTMDVLAKGVFLGLKHAARIMRAQNERGGDGGSIINTASIAGLSGDAGPMIYSAAKAAVISLSKSGAIELAPDKIRVNAICPGFIATPLAAGASGDDKIAQTRARFANTQPWPEYGDGEHIAGTALFLAGDDARFITGEAIVVDGGLTAAGPELSRRFPRSSARDSNVSGVTKGSTGEAADIRRLES